MREPLDDEYDNIPIYYCNNCLSLKIRAISLPKEELNNTNECPITNEVKDNNNTANDNDHKKEKQKLTVISYCDNCGGTNIKNTSIIQWEKLYVKRYGKSFLEQSNNKKKK